ncbi:lysine--tRNA ligase [Vulcanisaeta thermophila]|uniref:lysine--tRNA ligase n=1 Tax=Vulcanisaeta thermophila TaxID=867917 RepID=UPI000853B08D|nr:lysine--tRNA ligase [Vulcanisaeta thermophila]
MSYTHWIDRIAEQVMSRCKSLGKDECVLNGGLSVSGLQHIGRLRGEIIMNSVIAEKLRDAGFRVRQILTLYTVDPWKGKDKQLEQFVSPDVGRKYVEWPLERVPDPKGCHRSWVEHYWRDFGDYLDYFARNVEVITTGELYRESPRMREFIVMTMERKDKLIEVINKYRGRNPYPRDWVPFEPICENCGRIGTAEVTKVDLEKYEVEYRCTYCGYQGRTKMTNGKLPWRIEWVAIWYTLNVDFEPYGKDHAMPGGSRDSALDIARTVYGIEPPMGTWYEWVGYVVNGKDVGDMGSSDFIGFTPREWVEVAEPEVLRYIYIFHEPTRRLTFGLENVYQYVDMYDRAERLYYGVEKPSPKEKDYLDLIIKSYQYAQLRPIPREMPLQLPYLHAVALIQTLPASLSLEDLVNAAIKRLRDTRVLTRDLDELSIERIRSRLLRARNWLNKYAPETFRIKPLETLPETIKASLTDIQREKLRLLINELEKLTSWDEESIKEAMKRVPRESKDVERAFFEATYLVFFGKPSGPRIAPYLAMLGRDFVLGRLRDALG